MRFLRALALFTLSGLVLATLASVESQTSTTTLNAAFTGQIQDASGAWSARFEDGKPCKGYWVQFVADDQKSGITHVWYLNGNKDPYGFNQTSIRFSLGGVGEYVLDHHIYSGRDSAVTTFRFTSIECGGQATAQPVATTTGSTATANRSPWAQISVLSQRLCLNEKVVFSGESSFDEDGDPIVAWRWAFSGPGGGSGADGAQATFVAIAEGEHRVSLTVHDGRGAAGSTEIAYWFYQCYETGSTQTAYPTRTYDSRCSDLRAAQEKFYTDWKYRYNAYVESGRTDAEYERQLLAERESFDASWQARWQEYGCDYGGGGTSDDCVRRQAAAQADLDAIQRRYDGLWAQYWTDLETARKNFSASYHTDEEWRAFEAAWGQRTEDLTARQKAELEAVVAKHNLYECGSYDRTYEPSRTDYGAVYGTQAPVAESAYVHDLNECDAKLMAVREAYGQRLDLLAKELAATPPGEAYDAKKREYLALEQQMSVEMSAIMSGCREQYKESYDAPASYDEGAGDLRCHFDEQLHRIVCHGKYVSFQGNPDSQRLSSYQCGGQLFFDEIYANSVFEDFSFERAEDGGVLAIRSDRLKLLIHDSPRGVINVGVAGAEVYFVPAGYLRVAATDGKVVLEGAGTRGLFLGSEGAFEWNDIKRVLTIRGEATWVSETCYADGSSVDGDDDSQYFQAIESGRLGAAVTISFDGEVEQSDEKYDDGMQIEVRRDADKKYEATIDSADGGCKTVVLKFDGSIFATLDLRVTLVDENGRTLTIEEADNLEDVLDPCNDGEQGFEYWIVQDRLGTKVIVSFAHFSEKRVSVEAASVANVIVPGLDAPVAVLAVAAGLALAVVVRRRITR